MEDTVDLARTQEAGRRRWRRLAGALALLLVLMVAGWLWQVRQQQLFWDEPRVCPDLQFEFWSPGERVVLDPYPGGMRGPFEDDGSVFHVPPVIAWERESELVQTLELGADDPRTLRFQLDFEKSEQELLVLRWPLVRQGEALGLEDGEAVPYDTQDRLRNENGVPPAQLCCRAGLSVLCGDFMGRRLVCGVSDPGDRGGGLTAPTRPPVGCQIGPAGVNWEAERGRSRGREENRGPDCPAAEGEGADPAGAGGAAGGVRSGGVKMGARLNLPDAALFEPLARELGVTIPELLRGEREAATAADPAQAVRDTLSLAEYRERQVRRGRAVIRGLAALLVLLVGLPLLSPFGMGLLWGLGPKLDNWRAQQASPDLPVLPGVELRWEEDGRDDLGEGYTADTYVRLAPGGNRGDYFFAPEDGGALRQGDRPLAAASSEGERAELYTLDLPGQGEVWIRLTGEAGGSMRSASAAGRRSGWGRR